MKLDDKQIIGIILITASIISLFFTKDLGLPTVCTFSGIYLFKSQKSAQDARNQPDNL